LSHALVLNVHRVARGIRERDLLGLRSQMLRAAMSIPANIVEGTGHQSPREFIRFLRIASGSASELEYHLLVAKDFGILSEHDFSSLSSQTAQVRKMLYGLITRLSAEHRTHRTAM
jgi:four helix bundle protein